MKYLVGIDIGTSGTKSALFDLDGNVIASATAEYPLHQPRNGWAEQDPEDWWQAVKTTLGAITPKAADGEIVGVGLSGQMHGLVMLDENNEVIRNAILWCDGRSTEECADIERAVGRARLIEITANPAIVGFTASKILWVRKHEPEKYARCRMMLLPKDYIRFRLTGEFATEVSDASGTQLLDVGNRCWSEEVCRLLDVDLSMLPKMHESVEVTGRVTAEVAKATGLPTGVVVAGGAGDNAAAAVGTGVCQNGRAFTTVGTSGVVYAHSDKPVIDKRGRVHTFCCAVPGAWHVMGVTQAAGLSLNWFRNHFAKQYTYAELDALCAKVPVGAERLLYLPYLMGERTPVLDSDARGAFVGLSAVHGVPEMTRAVMEGVSYSLRNCFDILSEMGVETTDMMLCGGGAKSAFWRQMLADVYAVSVKTPASSEGAALGAAILGGCAAGVYASVEEGCARAVRAGASISPCKEAHGKYMEAYALYNRLYDALKPTFDGLRDAAL